MGEVVLAAKITHVPSMYLSELPGEHNGCRKQAIDGLKEISRLARERGADTFVVFDTHWLVNAGFHVNSNVHHKGVYTSHELPHFIRDLPYDFKGCPELCDLIAEEGNSVGLKTRSHQIETLDQEYGTIVPMRYMNPEGDISVVSIAAWCAFASHAETVKFGKAIRRAIEKSDRKVAILASGSMSHQFWDNHLSAEGLFTISREFHRQMDLRVLDLWQNGEIETFCNLLPEYARYCHGEGNMHDTAMLFGALGWKDYKGRGEVIGEYFASSGTGQCNVNFTLD